MTNPLKVLPWLALITLAVVSVPRSAQPAQAPGETHPHIRAAIQELRQARRELQSAASDFCGHRAAAMQITDNAIRQLQTALECDQK